jgi:RHS repeat-associated protein
MNLNGSEYYYIYNAQSDVIALFGGQENAVVVEYTYDAWGKPLGVTGLLSASVGVKNPYRYRGYRYDEETGLYYLQSRYYNPRMGRFINADGLILDGSTLLEINLFAYCVGNPMLYYDPTGKAIAYAGETGGGVTAGMVLYATEKLIKATPLPKSSGSSNSITRSIKTPNPIGSATLTGTLTSPYVDYQYRLTDTIKGGNLDNNQGWIGGNVKASIINGIGESIQVFGPVTKYDKIVVDIGVGSVQAGLTYNNQGFGAGAGAALSGFSARLVQGVSIAGWSVEYGTSAKIPSAGGQAVFGPANAGKVLQPLFNPGWNWGIEFRIIPPQ